MLNVEVGVIRASKPRRRDTWVHESQYGYFCEVVASRVLLEFNELATLFSEPIQRKRLAHIFE